MLSNDFFVTLATLIKGSENLFLAVGSGEPAWDAGLPPDDRGVSRLVHERARRAVAPEDVVFLDPAGQETEVPSPRLRIRAVFAAGEGTATLRETGLFGGPATAAADTGTLLAYYSHPRLGKAPEMTLDRRLTIDLTPKPYAPGARVTRYLGNTRTEEFHDLENLQANCQIEEIRFDRRFYLSGTEQAEALDYDYCAYCFGPELSQR